MMDMTVKYEYLDKIRLRYKSARKPEKKSIPTNSTSSVIITENMPSVYKKERRKICYDGYIYFEATRAFVYAKFNFNRN